VFSGRRARRQTRPSRAIRLAGETGFAGSLSDEKRALGTVSHLAFVIN
jgi:hypothetical protein